MAGDDENNNEESKADEEVEEEEEEDLEKLQAEIERMEKEAAEMSKETAELSKKEGKDEKPAARDECSIYIGQVDYSATPEELLKIFEACGAVERITIVCDKFTGRPKGFAYLEFREESAVPNAVKLDGAEFKGRQLKVTQKRVNQFGFNRGGGRGGGGGFRGGRGYRGGYRGRGRFRGRGGGRGGYHPYY